MRETNVKGGDKTMAAKKKTTGRKTVRRSSTTRRQRKPTGRKNPYKKSGKKPVKRR